jgi:hypothetical protein
MFADFPVYNMYRSMFTQELICLGLNILPSFTFKPLNNTKVLNFAHKSINWFSISTIIDSKL